MQLLAAENSRQWVPAECMHASVRMCLNGHMVKVGNHWVPQRVLLPVWIMIPGGAEQQDDIDKKLSFRVLLCQNISSGNN